MQAGTLVQSTTQGRYALDEPQGYELTSGDIVTIMLGGYYIAGSIVNVIVRWRTLVPYYLS